MNTDANPYQFIKKWKDDNLFSFTTTGELNTFHDSIMKKVFNQAFLNISSKIGKAPCSFSWFVVGSSGRFEQAFKSDQDHGLIFEFDTTEVHQYFHLLGKEISFGLNEVGYPYCAGKVMSSNPLWCQSLTQWKQQINQWAEEESLDTIRYLQILFDARNLVGVSDFVLQVKNHFLNQLRENPKLFTRFLENSRHIRKTIGLFGQLFVEQKGIYEGSIDFKQSAYIPYVNTIRLLAIKEKITESSTLTRIHKLSHLSKYSTILVSYEKSFRRLLDFRMHYFKGLMSYEDSHYLHVQNLSKQDKKDVTIILKDAEKFHYYIQNLLSKG